MIDEPATDVWARVGSGDQDAYGQIYVFYFRSLYNYGRKMTTNIAVLEDALQETLVAVWTGRGRLQGVERPHSYLLQPFALFCSESSVGIASSAASQIPN